MRNSISRTRPYFWTAIILALMLFSEACSSSSGTADASDPGDAVDAAQAQTGDEEAETADTEDGAPAGGDFDCEVLGKFAATLRGANGWLPQITDQESMDLFGGDLDAVDEAIEGLRPIQDIDGIFGTPREGLDNMAADTQAAREGRYSEMVGDYGVVAVSAVLGEEVCK